MSRSTYREFSLPADATGRERALVIGIISRSLFLSLSLSLSVLLSLSLSFSLALCNMCVRYEHGKGSGSACVANRAAKYGKAVSYLTGTRHMSHATMCVSVWV